ncbi:hypothetical protein A3L12_03675 [Thermococcus sp. P6]|uniref:tetratricopeptide repeat protein n=1 Tax=Thermococcus sp. P6 TaxID=122420 RepID=UPI000B5A1573|nr:hypothetical protein [Thermococcus sp. P6]ASJ10461.1 hypothetical protein A3L12_03675 [Thermococcus sp. P6]
MMKREEMEEIMGLFREALTAENAGNLSEAKRKLDRIMELSREREPVIYFEACFRLAEIFLQEENYRGAVKCAIRGIHSAPNEEFYRIGVKRLGDILFIMKREGRLKDLSEGMEVTLKLVEDEEELHRFVLTLLKMAGGEEVAEEFNLKEFNEILESLRG